MMPREERGAVPASCGPLTKLAWRAPWIVAPLLWTKTRRGPSRPLGVPILSVWIQHKATGLVFPKS